VFFGRPERVRAVKHHLYSGICFFLQPEQVAFGEDIKESIIIILCRFDVVLRN
jgi:hypothetical protein